MTQARSSSFEFVRQFTDEPEAEAPDEAAREAARKASFAFVKQLAEELSTGKFELPPFPETAMRVRDALANPDVSIDVVARIVLSEPVLAARLLRMANSAQFRRGPAEVTDVKLAISRLGFEMVRNASVSLAMDNTFTVPKGSALGRHIETTRRHSVEVAALSYVLARRARCGVGADEAMLTGLLHDIGRFYILTRVEAFPDLFSDPASLDELLHDWHTGVGRAIVESWGFAPAVAEAVDEHECLEREHAGKADLTDVVLVANFLAHRGDPRRTGQPAMAGIPGCVKMNLDEPGSDAVIAESTEEIRSMAQALGG